MYSLLFLHTELAISLCVMLSAGRRVDLRFPFLRFLLTATDVPAACTCISFNFSFLSCFVFLMFHFVFFYFLCFFQDEYGAKDFRHQLQLKPDAASRPLFIVRDCARDFYVA